MKRLFFVLVVLFCLLAAVYKSFFYFDSRAEQSAVKQHEQVTRLTSGEMAKLREGDFILRRGFGFFSDYVATKLNSGPVDVTHAGIIIKQNGVWQVVHSLSSDVSNVDGMQIQSLDDFLNYSVPGKIIITRAKGGTAILGNKIAVKAKEYLNLHLPFDHQGKYDDDSSLFCTELIWKILEKDLHHSILPQEKEERKQFFYSMMPMYNSQYFDIVINQYSSSLQ